MVTSFVKLKNESASGRRLTLIRRAASFIAALVLSATVVADELNIASGPLVLGGQVDPNITLLLDNSKLVKSEVVSSDNYTHFYPPEPGERNARVVAFEPLNPDISSSLLRVRHEKNPSSARVYRSVHNNVTYYNPLVTYLPWVDYMGTEFDDATPSCAKRAPLIEGTCLNLTELQSWGSPDNNRHGWVYKTPGLGAGGSVFDRSEKDYWPAVYYNYDPSLDDCSESGKPWDSTGTNKWDMDCYQKIEIRPTVSSYIGGPNRTDCAAAPNCNYQEEIQNFANWFTYHRTPVKMLRSGLSRGLANLGSNFRLAMAGFHTSNNRNFRIAIKMEPFLDYDPDNNYVVHRQNVYNDLLTNHLLRIGNTGSHDYHSALDRVGEYLRYRSGYGNSRFDPMRVNEINESFETAPSCRRNAAIMLVSNHAISKASSNYDNTSGPVHTNPQGSSLGYSPADPFRDGHTGTLADVAHYWWSRDLREDMDNTLPATEDNPAFWQHMETHVVYFGPSHGTIDIATAELARSSGTAIEWPNPGHGLLNLDTPHQARIDDLLHTAINGHGKYFGARTAQEIEQAVTTIINGLKSNYRGSQASVATSSNYYEAGESIFQTSYQSSDWSGELTAFEIGSDEELVLKWRASEQMPDHADRNIITWKKSGSNGGSGVAFSQLSDLDDIMRRGLSFEQDQLSYVRGDQSNEQGNGGTLRTRDNLLGDIVNSSPAYVDSSDHGFGQLSGSEGQLYGSYIASSAYTGRTPMVYVGANDGMLHGFAAETGIEMMAYLPVASAENLLGYADVEYVHQYFVDASPTVSDAYVGDAGSKSWKTLLVGATGAGGRGIFAIDVSDPDNITPEDVLWEFSHNNLGYTIGEPLIARAAGNGQWVAIFGNGYNSDSHTAGLFIVDLFSGELVKYIDTAQGSSSTPNGLSTPAGYDSNGDMNIEYLYAGDLHGNLWKFDITNSDPDDWSIATFGDTTGPLFVATSSSPVGASQPITAKPAISTDPYGVAIINFGTGSFITVEDAVISAQPTVQSLYGIQDTGEEVLRSDLKEWDFEEKSIAENRVRVVSEASSASAASSLGWVIDLKESNGDANGERSVAEPLLWDHDARVIFSTMTPAGDICSNGGVSGFMMEVDRNTGSPLPFTPFDTNKSGTISAADNYVDSTGSAKVVSGIALVEGGFRAPKVMYHSRDNPNQGVKISNGANAVIEKVYNGTPPGRIIVRRSWQQLK